jgi:hypothetical protein
MADWTWIPSLLIRLGSWLSRKSSIPGLHVIPSPGKARFGPQSSGAVYFEFRNRTKSVVVLSRARLFENQKNFPAIGERDISEGSRILKFKLNGFYTQDEITVQPNDSAETVIGISRPLDKSFDSDPPRRFSKWGILAPRYFALQYTVTVGNKTSTVKLVR